MTRTAAINKLYSKYNKYGITKTQLSNLIFSGLSYNLSIKCIYNGLRFASANEFNEHELFSLDDICEMLETDKETLMQQIKELNIDLKQYEVNNNEVNKITLLYPNGIN